MGLKNKIENSLEVIKLVLEKRKYKIISLVFGVLVFSFLYYFLVAKVADNSIWISVMMSGALFTTISIVTILLTSSMSGILLSLTLFKYDSYKKINKGGFFGFVGSGVAAFGVGCPTCGAFLFGIIGLPLALMYLPFRGLELQFLGLIILMVSIYLTASSIGGICKIYK